METTLQQQSQVLEPDFDLSEVIDGVTYMSPAPNLRHQEIVAELFFLLKLYLKSKLILMSPYDIKISETSVVQPDIIVFANIQDKEEKKLPLIVIEVISVSSIVIDRIKKFSLYESANIQEYWIVDPETECIEVYDLQDGVYTLHIQVTRQGMITSIALPNLTFQIENIFN